MEKNIFEGAKFGDKYVTNKGNIVLYINDKAVNINSRKYGEISILHLLVDNKSNVVNEYLSNGVWWTSNLEEDIVSRYQDPIDEKKLDELAWKYEEENPCIMEWAVNEAYKAGYRKAMAE